MESVDDNHNDLMLYKSRVGGIHIHVYRKEEVALRHDEAQLDLVLVESFC